LTYYFFSSRLSIFIPIYSAIYFVILQGLTTKTFKCKPSGKSSRTNSFILIHLILSKISSII